VTSRIPDPADPFEEEGLASDDSSLPGKQITGDTQDDTVVPAESPVVVDDYGTTGEEERAGEPMDVRLGREEPDRSADDPVDDSEGADSPYPTDREEAVGRLVEDDEGARGDDEDTSVAHDVGTDRGGFSAEERAMHIEPGP
jgi:hypothetical protein